MMNEAAMAVTRDQFWYGGITKRLWFSLILQINEPLLQSQNNEFHPSISPLLLII